ncbi:60S ribosomal protein L43, partial [Coemansia sp. RSA 2049]
TGPIVGQGGGSSLGSIGGHDSTTAGNTTAQPDVGAAGVVRAQSSTSAAAQTNEATRRRTRTTLTPYQLRVLFRVWERTQYPSSDLRFRLATSLMMTPRNVQIWFQNQRQKTKERAEMRRRTHSPSLNPSAMSGVSVSTAPQGQQRQALHIHPQPPAHFVESHTRDEHAAAAAASLPVRHALLQHHDSAAASAVGTVPHSQNSSPVPVSYSMLTPPALYSQSFSQQRQQQQHLPALYSHHPHNMQSLPPHQQTQPQTPLNPAHPHMHHQRHASQPHPVHYLQPQAALASASTKVSEATAKPKGSVFSPQDSSLHQSPRPLATPKQNEADASEVNATAKRMLQLPPPLHTSHGQMHFGEHNIPSPATPTLMSEKHETQQPPSPLASRLRHPSPPLTTPMALMSMSRQGLAIDQIPSSETRQHPANGRARLADILNPITSYGMQSSSCAPQDARMNQSGPLPSLGSLLASVQKDANSPLAGNGTRNTLSQSRSSSSIAKRTKKVGITGKYGTRYGSSLRKQIKKMEITQHARYTCSFCGKESIKRTAVGIWKCKGCSKTIAGGAWTVQTNAATTTSSTIRRLREMRDQ